MAEAARKALGLQLQRMVWLEDGVRAGQDREAMHDMRVATRRMRASLRVFEGYIYQKTVKPFAQTLRRAGRTLGAVRDMDVFMEKAERYLASLPYVPVLLLDLDLAEGDVANTRGIYARKDMLNRPVFAGRIHSLKHDEGFVLMFGIEQFLQFGDYSMFRAGNQSPARLGLTLTKAASRDKMEVRVCDAAQSGQRVKDACLAMNETGIALMTRQIVIVARKQ